MERITYAGDSILTGTDISRALLDYAQALARKETSATVEIPVRRADGSLAHANILIGPASQLFAEDVESEYDEVVDDDLVAHLRREAAALGPLTIVPGDPDDAPSGADDLEFPRFEEL